MEIQPNHRTHGPSPAAAHRVGPRRDQPTTEQVNFEGTTAVNKALENTPEKRVEVVQRAKELANDPAYPPREMVRRLSRFLAGHLDAK